MHAVVRARSTRHREERRDVVARCYRDQLSEWLEIGPRILGHLPGDSAEALALGIDATRYAVAKTVSMVGKVSRVENDVRRLNELATHDPLTGVANRRGMESRLAAEWRRANRHARPLSVIVVDIDHLKTINDRFGHEAGDALIAAVASRLRSSLREEDLVARVGGDEFVIICPEVPDQAIPVVAAKLQLSVTKPELELPGTHRVAVAASFGWASAGGETEFSDLLHRADLMMYSAKRRNKRRSNVTAPRRPRPEKT